MNRFAQLLAAQGRNGDTELLHVTKGELAALRGLGAMTGRRVTTNPSTGLPEAFDFANIIPAVVGIGATVLSGGTLSPLTAGLISGAATTAATGDINKGLVAGVTGGALSGLGGAAMGGVTDAATGAAASQAAGSAAGQAGAQAAQAGAWAPGFGEAAVDAAGGAAGAGAWAPGFGEAAVDAGSATISQGGQLGAQAAQQSGGIGGMMDWATKNPSAAMMGIGALGSMMPQGETGGGGMSKADKESYERAKEEKTSSRDFMAPTNPYYAMDGGGEHDYFSNTRYNFAAGGPVLPAHIEQDTGAMKAIKSIRSRYRSRKAAEEDMKVPNSYMQRLGIVDPNSPLLDYAFGYTKNQGRRKMASGNLQMPMGFFEGGAVDARRQFLDIPVQKQAALMKQSTPGMPQIDRGTVKREVVPAPPKKRVNKTMMAGGGAVKGQGDGMSDSVPAVINGRRPAALANDEFVVPADVVSGLGNGSSEAGHQQLYGMIQRVRAARTGTTRQAPAINPKKVMPS